MLARKYARQLYLRRESEPLHHAQQEAQGPGECAGELAAARPSAGSEAGTHPVSAPAEVGSKCRATGDIAVAAAQEASLHLRVPRALVAARRRERRPAQTQRGALYL